MTIPVLGSVNWLWLLVGIALGWFVIPMVSAKLGV